MQLGDKINLKNGCEGTVIKCGLSDFIGDPFPLYVQFIKDNKAQVEVIMSNELRKK